MKTTTNHRYTVALAGCLSLMLITACATQSGQPRAPEVNLIQLSKVPDVQVHSASGLPMEYELQIRNVFDHPVTLVSVEIESVGVSGAYGMKRVRHAFDLTIPPNSSESVAFRAWVQPLQENVRGETVSPVMLRGTARFESPNGVMRRNFSTRGQ